jgi:IS5 family transposase
MKDAPFFGYKAHVAVDRGAGLVRQAIRTPANVSDKTPFLGLAQGDEQVVYADKGYHGWWYRQCRLTACGHARNRAIGRNRAPVERTFATLKRWCGYRRVRYRFLMRNGLRLQLLALAMNLHRALVLTA